MSLRSIARFKGAARLRRDAPNAGGLGAISGPPWPSAVLEVRHAFAGTLRRLGGLGGHFGAPHIQKAAAASRRRTSSRAWAVKAPRSAAAIGSPGMNFSPSGLTKWPFFATR